MTQQHVTAAAGRSASHDPPYLTRILLSTCVSPQVIRASCPISGCNTRWKPARSCRASIIKARCTTCMVVATYPIARSHHDTACRATPSTHLTTTTRLTRILFRTGAFLKLAKPQLKLACGRTAFDQYSYEGFFGTIASTRFRGTRRLAWHKLPARDTRFVIRLRNARVLIGDSYQ
jgi:hypothetical protein